MSILFVFTRRRRKGAWVFLSAQLWEQYVLVRVRSKGWRVRVSGSVYMLYISHEPSERVAGLPPSLSDYCKLDAKRAHVNFSVFARLFPELFNAINENSCFKAAFNFHSTDILFCCGDNMTGNPFIRLKYLYNLNNWILFSRNSCFENIAVYQHFTFL